ncbi:NAD(P)/FAD-dependent oxidoreductase [Streptomyces sp. NPDC004126]|uniref:NAD(P)/FAD-dependent oxidoreductase n=1 Tax=Streptomyces sp. NPDC004126 TaxID=3390695 RepID=UPI003D02125D
MTGRAPGPGRAERIVVIGYGPAAHRLVEGLHRHGAHGRVTVLGAEPEPAYNRPLLTAVLDGTLPARALRLPEPPPGTVLGLGVRAVSFDPRRRLVRTADGDAHPYDRLVLATGASPVPPGPGWTRGPDGRPAPGVRALRTLADGERIAGARGPVAVVGGGVLGVEAALALRRRGRPVALVHRGPYPLDRHVDPRAGEAVAGRLRNLAVDLRLGRTVAARDDGGAALALDDGSRVEAGEVLLCVGTRPRVGLARAAGLAVRTGVLVDHLLRTSAARVYAIGDCAEPLDGGAHGPAGRVPAGGFSSAWEQAETLAALLTGGRIRYSGGQGVLRLKAPELDLLRVGTTAGAEETVVLGDAAAGRYARLSLRSGRLTGAVLVGFHRAAAGVVRLHQRGEPVPVDRLALLLGEPPAYEAGPPPGTALVCHCNNVTGDALAAAWRAGARTAAALAAATRAGTGCGSCAEEVRARCEAWAREEEAG